MGARLVVRDADSLGQRPAERVGARLGACDLIAIRVDPNDPVAVRRLESVACSMLDSTPPMFVRRRTGHRDAILGLVAANFERVNGAVRFRVPIHAGSLTVRR